MEKGCYFPRGKMLGGSSSMNLFMYVRGNPQDYNHWVELGNPGWDSQTVLEYFKKSEGNTYNPFVDGDRGKYHSNKGPLKVSFSNTTQPGEKLFIDANAELGLKFTVDVNGKDQIGTTNWQGTIYDGHRESTAMAFLAPSKDRPNLHVVKNAFVEKILIDGNSKAQSVQYMYKGAYRRVAHARKEVILSAGSYMNSVILMQSGIGPAQQLRKFNIRQKVDLPVGESLFDHLGALTFFTFNPTQSSKPTDLLDAIYDLAIHRTGKLAVNPQIGAFLNSKGTSKTLPDTQISFVYFPVNSSADINTMFASFGVRQEFIDHLVKVNQLKDIGVDYVVALRPKSRGFVHLNGSSPYDVPEINPNYFGNNDDLEDMVTFMERQISLQTTRTFRKYGGQVFRMPLPACDKFRYLSRDYLKCYARQFTSTAYHPLGTCKMGPTWDNEAVVSPQLKVYKVEKLRVIDASM